MQDDFAHEGVVLCMLKSVCGVGTRGLNNVSSLGTIRNLPTWFWALAKQFVTVTLVLRIVKPAKKKKERP